MSSLEIKDLVVSVEGKTILNGIDLVVESGSVHAIMGPNGSGKSTLSLAIMGHPKYKVERGQVLLDGVNLLKLPVDARARAGVFLAFQYPSAIPGVSVANFLRTAINARRVAPTIEGTGEVKKNDMPIPQFRKLLAEKMKLLGVDDSFITRSVNDGFSGGEKKRLEILQMHMFQPRFAILDETDSGLDIDALKVVAEGIDAMRSPEVGMLLITHYERILRYVHPDFVHVLVDGRIVRTGGPELAAELESKGYEFVREEHNANIHRGVYEFSERTTALFEEARAKVARFINAPSEREIIFVRNATEALNLVAYAWGRDNIKRGDRIVTTVLEHHSDFVPWQQLATEVGAEIAVVDIDDDGRLRRDQLSAELRKGAKLLAITHTSNGLGTVNPVKEIAAEARAAGATVLVDVAQAVPHTPVDVQDLGADFVAFSGHKMLAPPGSGGLWGRAEILEKMRPFLYGGD